MQVTIENKKTIFIECEWCGAHDNSVRTDDDKLTRETRIKNFKREHRFCKTRKEKEDAKGAPKWKK